MFKNKSWLIFLLVAIAQFMVVLDSSITNVALPAIKQSLHFNTDTLQWIVTAYSLTFGGFLLLGGRTADLFGRKKTLLFGMGAFTLVSFIIGISQSAFLLIVLRALQGLAAAFMSPAALSIVLTIFPEGTERNKALSLWTTVATGGAALGLLLGGFLTEFINWRWNFFINVPVGIVISLAIALILPAHEKEETTHKNLDLLGASLITGGIMTLVFTISEASIWGWTSIQTISLLILAIVFHVFFVIREKTYHHPLMSLDIFSSKNVVIANIMMALLAATLFGNFFITSLYLQTILHYSSFITGLSFLPFPLILGITSSRTPKLVAKYGFKPFLILGPMIVMTGLAFLTIMPVNGNYFSVLPSFVLIPLGMGLTFMPVVLTATTGIPAHKAGLASGLINTSQQMGGALGLAVLSSISTTATNNFAGNISSPSAIVEGYHMAFFTTLFFLLLVVLAATVVNSGKKKLLNNSQIRQPILSE